VPRTWEEALAVKDRAIVVTELEPPFRVVHVNVPWTKMCGFTNAELVGQTLGCIQGPSTNKDTLKLLKHVVGKHEVDRFALVNYHKSGRAYLVAIAIRPLVDQDGQATHCVGGATVLQWL